MKNLLLTFWDFLVSEKLFFSCCFQDIYCWYVLYMYDISSAFLLGICWASWNVDCYSPIWGVFSHYFFDYIFSASFPYFCEKSFLLLLMLLFLMVFHFLWDCWYVFIIFLHVLQIVQSLSIYIQVSDISATLYYIYCWVPGMNFFFLVIVLLNS